MDSSTSLSIKRIAIDSLNLDSANARLHPDTNLDAITASLKRFGQAEPLVVQAGTARVIAGNGRLVAMRKLGWTECDVVELEIDDLKATALGIALNRTAELAEWDEPVLGRLLDELRKEGALEGIGYALTSLIRCARCGSKWQGYKTGKGRKKPGEKRIETFYYACGGYVSKGNAVCGRALIAKAEFEQTVVAGARDHLQRFLTSGGADLLQSLLLEVANPTGAEANEKALRSRLTERQRKLDEMVASITPALASVLEQPILALRDEVRGIEDDLARARQGRMDASEAKALVDGLLADAGRIESLLATAATSDTRDLLRAIVQDVVVDPEKGEVEVTLYAMPRLGGGDGGSSGTHVIASPTNEERTRPAKDMSSHMYMAGARLVGQKRTCRVRVVRKPWIFRRLPLRRVAV